MNQLSAEEFFSWQETKKDYFLLDIREDWERASYNIGGTHLPLSEVISRRDEIPQDIPVVIYCEKGIRSAIVIQRLEESGYGNLYNLEGGMKAWKEMKKEY